MHSLLFLDISKFSIIKYIPDRTLREWFILVNKCISNYKEKNVLLRDFYKHLKKTDFMQWDCHFIHLYLNIISCTKLKLHVHENLWLVLTFTQLYIFICIGMFNHGYLLEEWFHQQSREKIHKSRGICSELNANMNIISSITLSSICFFFFCQNILLHNLDWSGSLFSKIGWS